MLVLPNAGRRDGGRSLTVVGGRAGVYCAGEGRGRWLGVVVRLWAAAECGGAFGGPIAAVGDEFASDGDVKSQSTWPARTCGELIPRSGTKSSQIPPPGGSPTLRRDLV